MQQHHQRVLQQFREAAAEAGITKMQIVDADGETIIAVRRSGLTDAQKARLAVVDNRANETSDWDTDVLTQLAADGMDLSDLFTGDEFSALANLNGVPDDPNELWQGMPEFVTEPLAIKTIHVHFKSLEDVKSFAALLQQPITEQTRSVWHPMAEKRDLKSFGYTNES